jgi:hypothetical protein
MHAAKALCTRSEDPSSGGGDDAGNGRARNGGDAAGRGMTGDAGDSSSSSDEGDSSSSSSSFDEGDSSSVMNMRTRLVVLAWRSSKNTRLRPRGGVVVASVRSMTIGDMTTEEQRVCITIIWLGGSPALFSGEKG